MPIIEFLFEIFLPVWVIIMLTGVTIFILKELFKK